MPETRWEQFKKYALITFIFLFIATPIVAVTPWGPAQVRAYIEKHNPPGRPVEPWATEWMYKLGRFYSMTLRDDDAAETYRTLFKWYFKKERGIPKDDVHVGLSLYHYSIILFDTGHKQKGTQKLEQFLARWGDDPDMDPIVVRTARNRVAHSPYRSKN